MQHSEIIEGMAEIFWGLAWADWADENGINLSGKDILEEMPEIPEESYYFSYRVLGMYEVLNDIEINALFCRAIRFDGNKVSYDNAEMRKRFGNCLAYMALGTGVSWFDDHAEFGLQTPYIENDMIPVAFENEKISTNSNSR